MRFPSIEDKPIEPPAGSRLEDESDEAYEAFCVFRDLRPRERCLLAVADIVGYQVSELMRQQGRVGGDIDRWSQQFRWRRRCELFDSEQEWIRRQRLAELRQQLEDERLDELELIKEKVLKRLRSFDPDELKPLEAIRMLETIVKIEERTLPQRDKKRALSHRPSDDDFRDMIDGFRDQNQLMIDQYFTEAELEMKANQAYNKAIAKQNEKARTAHFQQAGNADDQSQFAETMQKPTSTPPHSTLTAAD